MEFVNLTNNVAFNKIFRDEQQKEILISFLNAMLNLTGKKKIKELDLLNPYQLPKLESLKIDLLDIKIRDKQGATFIIKIQQVRNIPDLNKQFSYIITKSYSSQIERDSEAYKLQPVILIGILDFVAFESESYLNRHCICNTDNYEQELKDLEFYFLELPKFAKKAEELETVLEKWVYFIKNVADLDEVPHHADTKELKMAYKIASRFGWTPEELEIYDNWDMNAQDIWECM